MRSPATRPRAGSTGRRRVKDPLLPLGLFRNPSFTGAQLGAFAISASFFAVFLYATLYLQQVLGLSPIEAGLVYLPGTIAMFVVSGATASMLEKVHPGVLVSGGLFLVSGGMVLLTAAAVDSNWTVALPGTLMGMIGTGMFNPAVIAVALGSAPAERSGLAAGVNDTFRQAGIAVGVAALGALVPAEAALGGGSAADYVSGLDHALLAGAGLAALGTIAAAVLIRKQRSAAQASQPVPAAA